MRLMIQQRIRGGVSTIMHRFAHANNDYMGEAFDSNKPSSFITYLGANNLYWWAMSKPLPTHDFKWMANKGLVDWKNMPCILEVDLDDSQELHEIHNNYSLTPENIIPADSKVAKLIPNLHSKTKYVVHYENLKLYEHLGLKIIQIHRKIMFQENAWLKTFFDNNTSLRTRAQNDFEKDFCKLMNNSLFGKTMQNIENHVDIQLITDEKQTSKLAAQINCKRCTIFDENLVAIHMKET